MSPKAAQKKASRYAGFIGRFHPQAKRVLEIGCLHGHLLFGLRQDGYEVRGADVCDSARQYAQRNYGITVHEGEVPPPSLQGSFDVIILSHVIEHVLDPAAFVGQAARYLSAGGIIIVETPGLDTPLYRLFGASYNMVRPPEHISFFQANTFARGLKSDGIEWISTLTYSPAWDQKNIFFYGIMSLLKAWGILTALRKGKNPSIPFELTAPIGVRPGSWFDIAFRMLDYSCRFLNILFLPIIKVMDAKGLGLMLVAVGRGKD